MFNERKNLLVELVLELILVLKLLYNNSQKVILVVDCIFKKLGNVLGRDVKFLKDI